MIGTYVERKKTPLSPNEVVDAFRVAIRRVCGYEPTPEGLAVVVAGSALETGRWRSLYCYGFGNVKAGSTWPGLYYTIRLNEVETRSGKRVVVWYDPVLGELVGKNGPARYPNKPYADPPGHYQCRMRAFPDAASGAAEHVEFLAVDTTPNNGKPNRYARAWQAAMDGDPEAFCRELGAAGYYTADVDTYARAVVSLFRTYLPIAQAGEPPARLSEAAEDQLCLDMAECMRLELPDWLARKIEVLRAGSMTLDWGELNSARDADVTGND